ncbi:MAG: DUF4037 domain-containing protein [Lachnospiraceae bacterium]|nr:DUF4037 domain-containing protein [Lachnospiraceae bacterium]
MNIQDFIEGLDALFGTATQQDIETYGVKGLAQAKEEGDVQAQIIILNEMLGFYRESSQYDKVRTTVGEILDLMGQEGLEGTIPYGTALLNCGNALRAAGDLTESMDCYRQVFEIFDGQVPPEDFQYAELYNNVSLLYQELGRFDMAGKCLHNALSIIRQMPDKGFETAVTYVNLANSELQEEKLTEAVTHARLGEVLFEQLGVRDNHRAAGLAAMGEVCERQQEYQRAAGFYSQAADMVEQYMGQTEGYQRLVERRENAWQTVAEEFAREKEVFLQKKANEDALHTKGLEVSRDFFKTDCAKMIREQFPDYADRIGAGKFGEGSDCYGYDDAYSEDHDFGPGCYLWLKEKDAAEIGEALQNAYEACLASYVENHGLVSNLPASRMGVWTEEKLLLHVLGTTKLPQTIEEWLAIPEVHLAEFANGFVFWGTDGKIKEMRQKMMCYPEEVQKVLLAQRVTEFSQNGQYNYRRMANRQDFVAASLMKHAAIHAALRIVCLCNKQYAPHEKWLYRTAKSTVWKRLRTVCELCEQAVKLPVDAVEETVSLFEQMAEAIYRELCLEGDITPKEGTDLCYLAQYGPELAGK